MIGNEVGGVASEVAGGRLVAEAAAEASTRGRFGVVASSFGCSASFAAAMALARAAKTGTGCDGTIGGAN